MSYRIGKVIIVKNEGTVVFGNVRSIATRDDTSNGNEESTEDDAGDCEYDWKDDRC